MATLHEFIFNFSKNTIRVLITSCQSMKACLVPFSLLHKVKLGEKSNPQMVLYFKKRFGQWTVEDTLESRIWDQIPRAVSVGFGKHLAATGPFRGDSRQCLEWFSGGLPFASLSFEFPFIPGRGVWTTQTRGWERLPSPAFSLHFSVCWSNCVMGRNKA